MKQVWCNEKEEDVIVPISLSDETECFSMNVTGWLSVNIILANLISKKQITYHPSTKYNQTKITVY